MKQKLLQRTRTMQWFSNHCAAVCKKVCPILLSDRCLSCLSLCNVGYCSQTVGWIKMPLGMDVGLGRGHIVLDSDPAPPQRGTVPNLAHVCCGQTAGWIKLLLGTDVGLGPGDTVLHRELHGDPVPPIRAQQPPLLVPGLLWPIGWMDQDTSSYGGRPRPRPHCVRWRPSSCPLSPPRKGHSSSPLFGASLLSPSG